MKGLLVTLNIILIVFLCLFTLTQAYYRAPLHLLLFTSLCALCLKESMKIKMFFITTAAVFGVMFFISSQNASLANPIGLFLYYATWPAAFYFYVSNGSVKHVKKIIYFMLILCLIGDVVSLKYLILDPYVSRLMAGAASEDDLLQYQRMGIGGYGYVYAMVFLTYGIVRWFRISKSKLEKLFLLGFYAVNSLFIVYSSYTLAIIFTALLTVLAWLSNMGQGWKIFLICVGGISVYMFSSIILEIAYQAAEALELEAVSKRFYQLIQAQKYSSTDTLSRAELYMISWNNFVKNPMSGGPYWGGHSFLLDTLAQYGILGSLVLLFLKCCMNICSHLTGGGRLTILYFLFFIFICINACAVPQIPVVLFFIVPLIIYLERENKLI